MRMAALSEFFLGAASLRSVNDEEDIGNDDDNGDDD